MTADEKEYEEDLHRTVLMLEVMMADTEFMAFQDALSRDRQLLDTMLGNEGFMVFQDAPSRDAPDAMTAEVVAALEPWEIFLAVWDGDRAEIAALADAGVDLDCRDEGGHTPLHRAAERNLPDVVSTLIASGASLNLQTADSVMWTALHIACLHGHHSVVAALLKEGADTAVLDSRKETALQWAEANNEAECVRLLRQHRP